MMRRAEGRAAPSRPAPSPDAFPIVRRPPEHAALPVLVSIPHFGTDPLPGFGAASYRAPRYASFPWGYTDPFAPQIYGALHVAGATVVATPISRMFVDVNRARDDFELRDGEVRSSRGVVRTHIRGEEPVFHEPLRPDAAERRFARYYDPYHAAVSAHLGRLRGHFGRAVLVDAHTSSAAPMDGHEVVLGTRRGRTCSPALGRGVAAVVRRHGFACSFDVPGYAGGHTVRCHGAPGGTVQAVQIEFNATAIMRTTRHEYAEACRCGGVPEHDAGLLSRCAVCMTEVVRWLGGALCADAPGAGT